MADAATTAHPVVMLLEDQNVITGVCYTVTPAETIGVHYCNYRSFGPTRSFYARGTESIAQCRSDNT